MGEAVTTLLFLGIALLVLKLFLRATRLAIRLAYLALLIGICAYIFKALCM